MPTPPILLLYFVVQFMRRNLKILTLRISTSKHYFSFTTHFNYSETRVVSYIIASIRLVNFGSPSVTASFDVPLVSICAFFDFNSSCVTRGGMSVVPFLVKPWVSKFSRDFKLLWNRHLSCRYYTLRIDGVFPPNYQKSPSL